MAHFPFSSLRYSPLPLASASGAGSAHRCVNKPQMKAMHMSDDDHQHYGWRRSGTASKLKTREFSCCCNRSSNILHASVPSNGSRLHCSMQVVNPLKNRRYETLSYVPPLNADQVVKQVDYIVDKGWIPCLEFDQNATISRENSKECNYYDGRYWTLWKLPMFGCADGSMVLREFEECRKANPHSYVRLMAFDSKRQAQVVAVVVQKPSS